MSPHKQPHSLLDLSVVHCIKLVNSACYALEKLYLEKNEYVVCELKANILKLQLMSTLPARLFDVLCSRRTCSKYGGDPRIQLTVLTHPYITVFRKCDLDVSIHQSFWLNNLPDFKRLVILDLKFICTDEILEVIGKNCLMLEELNIVSKVDICKPVFNASVISRSVSDAGLGHIRNLKLLRILAMDSPRNKRAIRVGRCVSQVGIINLISELPYLEELRIESFDMGAAIVTAVGDVDSFSLSLRKMNCHFISADGIKKLIKVCPLLGDLSLTHLSEHDKDAVLDQITQSNLRLNKLQLSFFSFTDALHRLLDVKGSYLTYFSFWDIDYTLSLNAVITIGKCCQNLTSLCLITNSRCLVVPQNFKPDKIFSQLQDLTVGNNKFDIDSVLTFFVQCTQNLQKLVVKYQRKLKIDTILFQLIERGSLKNLQFLWLDCTLEVSKDIVIEIIKKCDSLRILTVDNQDDMGDIQKYISENNLDLQLGSY